MEIVQLNGDDEQLFGLVMHLTMDKSVLKYNLNYPFKTSENYVWFIAVEDGNTLGFIPAEQRDGKAIINNYYIGGDDSRVFSMLLKETVRVLLPDFILEAIAQVRHIPDFEQCGFAVVYPWKRYAKMQLFRKDEEKRV
jgi:hypothetical protein